MQGYIIKQNKARDEDLVVSIVTSHGLENLYRFYGARHGTINLGFKIDFESRSSLKSSISQLRDVVHLGFPWILDFDKLRLWQQFITLFHPHLHQNEAIESFYFELLDAAASRWGKQNSKRVAVESYIALLKYEGRLHEEMECFLCNEPIKEDISLLRAYLPTHKACSHRLNVNSQSLQDLYITQSSLFLNDAEIDILYDVMLEGL